MKADLHIHSNYSDGSEGVGELAENIKKAGIDIFALSDHDTIEGCIEMEKLNLSGFIPAVELTCICNSIKCHILRYNIDVNNKELSDLISLGKVLRRNKLETRIKYLKTQWNIDLTQDELNWLYTRKSVVKTHIANILVKRGLADDNQAAMRKYLDGCKAGDTRFDGKVGIEVIKNAGGIAVWAHPLGGEGERHLNKEEFLPKLKEMISFGIQGLECYYSRYTKEEIEFLASCAEENNLLITGGSDYHGANKDIPLLRLNTDNMPVDSSKLTLLEAIGL